ncbi:hypothetical protein GCM10010458_20960 [Microbacterium luteolum]
MRRVDANAVDPEPVSSGGSGFLADIVDALSRSGIQCSEHTGCANTNRVCGATPQRPHTLRPSAGPPRDIAIWPAESPDKPVQRR